MGACYACPALQTLAPSQELDRPNRIGPAKGITAGEAQHTSLTIKCLDQAPSALPAEILRYLSRF